MAQIESQAAAEHDDPTTAAVRSALLTPVSAYLNLRQQRPTGHVANSIRLTVVTGFTTIRELQYEPGHRGHCIRLPNEAPQVLDDPST